MSTDLYPGACPVRANPSASRVSGGVSVKGDASKCPEGKTVSSSLLPEPAKDFEFATTFNLVRPSESGPHL